LSADTFVVETAEQLRALSDPLRQRLLEQFADGATVKQAAARLGEKQTKLYHHVDQLLAAGLIVVEREEKRRATVERTFRTAARRFAVSPAAFARGARQDERERLARAGLEELLAGAAPGAGAFRLLRGRARLSESGRERLEAELARLLRELDDPAAPPVDVMLLSARRG
jgi:DNA-binding transcriptional ArsR family regulator